MEIWARALHLILVLNSPKILHAAHSNNRDGPEEILTSANKMRTVARTDGRHLANRRIVGRNEKWNKKLLTALRAFTSSSFRLLDISVGGLHQDDAQTFYFTS